MCSTHVREGSRPLGGLLSCSSYPSYVETGSHRSWQEVWKDQGQRLCEEQPQKNTSERLCSMISDRLPSWKINIPKFSSPFLCTAQLLFAVVAEDKTQICVWSPLCRTAWRLDIHVCVCLLPEPSEGVSTEQNKKGAFHHLRSQSCSPTASWENKGKHKNWAKTSSSDLESPVGLSKKDMTPVFFLLLFVYEQDDFKSLHFFSHSLACSVLSPPFHSRQQNSWCPLISHFAIIPTQEHATLRKDFR